MPRPKREQERRPTANLLAPHRWVKRTVKPINKVREKTLWKYALELQKYYPINLDNLQSGHRTETDNKHIKIQDKLCVGIIVRLAGKISNFPEETKKKIEKLEIIFPRAVKTHDINYDNSQIKFSKADEEVIRSVGKENIDKLARSIYSNFTNQEMNASGINTDIMKNQTSHAVSRGIVRSQQLIEKAYELFD